ncbi:hypothetical protein [Draconibacterium orientale]|uniref:Uncharacterized protein n=2 Tax=Draconibacterium orientale TaxID=1168034 RepID=A0ABM5QDB9_9BACT|nr:hypothetical protein [Draconibacterium orientale]AHW61544.1 hypothetical protein FH5T_03620 [Draconibacterium orientale]
MVWRGVTALRFYAKLQHKILTNKKAMKHQKPKRLPIRVTKIIRKTCGFLIIIGYVMFLFFIIDNAVQFVPREIKFRILLKIAVMLMVGAIGILLPVVLIYPYAKFEEFIVEKVIPQKIKIFFNIDKIEESYTPKEETK